MIFYMFNWRYGKYTAPTTDQLLSLLYSDWSLFEPVWLWLASIWACSALIGQAQELIVEKCICYIGFHAGPASVLRSVCECIGSGLLLPGNWPLQPTTPVQITYLSNLVCWHLSLLCLHEEGHTAAVMSICLWCIPHEGGILQQLCLSVCSTWLIISERKPFTDWWQVASYTQAMRHYWNIHFWLICS